MTADKCPNCGSTAEGDGPFDAICNNDACLLPVHNWPAVQRLKDENEGFKMELADREAGLRFKSRQIEMLKQELAALRSHLAQSIEMRDNSNRSHE